MENGKEMEKWKRKGEKRERKRRFLPALIAASTAAVGHARVVGRHAARHAERKKEMGHRLFGTGKFFRNLGFGALGGSRAQRRKIILKITQRVISFVDFWDVTVRPVDLRCQIWLSTYAPLLFGEFHKPKSKNYPDVHVLHRAYKSKNKTKGDIQYRPSSSSRTLPYARIEFLQISPIDSPGQTFTLHRLHHI